MILLLLIVGAIGLVWFFLNQASNEERKKLWSAYQQAMHSGDKAAALRAGRAYYAKLRGGRLTVYDEQALTNDLSTMP
jgi:hypothetical protein